MNDTPYIPKATQIIVLSELFTCYLKNELSSEFIVINNSRANRYNSSLFYEIYFENIKLSTASINVTFDLPSYLCYKELVDKAASKEIYNRVEEVILRRDSELLDFFIKLKQHIKDLHNRIELGNMFSDVQLKESKSSKI